MAPRGRRKKAGLMREDAARDRMRDLGFQERVITQSIKELLEVYGEDQWFLIEDESYASLLSICLEKQEKVNQQLAVVQANQLPGNQNEEMAEDQNQEIAGKEQPNQLVQEQEEENEQEQVQDMDVEHERDQAHELSITSEAVMDPSSANEQELVQDMDVEHGRDQAHELSITSEAVIDPSSATFHLGEASADFASCPVEGVENLHCGWLSEEEEETDPKEKETEPKEDSDGDDDEIIRLTPEPLCEELKELLMEVRGQKRRRRETRWDK
ncbi:PREDICTED: rho GTPase-activating protein gacV-like isoform X2 [Camelina sativa]|uniref:Rho GTPase-activating protein gacV-like isoform X2 n=1 Tax=Camelina sativa TaxID=90675 RepID=A0ABM0ZLF7_CAMSA|nr:PREDICTED: rho GTPase-activating protein gacV-like isoform X2 [Camelina sativa]XP_010517394.1 PREDICTED: rho GTPase-activating protein gacV-like isoform X2 [Camelina sativa]